MKRFTFFFWILFSFAIPASVSAYVINVGVGGSGLSGKAGPFATVTVSLDPITPYIAHIAVAGGTYGSNNTYMLGDGSAVALNVNAGHFSASDFIGFSLQGFQTPQLTDGGPKNVSEFGRFNFTLKDFDGWKYSAYLINLTLRNLTGSWASDSSVLTPNGKGFLAASHIFVPNTTPATVAGGAALTGYAGAAVPVPSSLLLLASGLVGLAGFSRKKNRGKTEDRRGKRNE